MPKPFTAAIAWRYMLTKKRHGAVGTISTVSVCAMAIATAAIICVLSVFNGFREIIGSRLDTLSPDVKVSPARGKVFTSADSLAAELSKFPGVAVATPTLADNALVIANGQEMPVTLKGVYPDQYAKVTAVKSLITKDYGTYFTPVAETDEALLPGDIPQAVAAIGVAARLRLTPDSQLLIFAPKRHGRVNMANPLASFLTDSLDVKGIYRSDQQEFDEDGILAPIEMVRDLLQYDDEASAIEIRTADGTDPSALAEKLSHKLGNEFVVKDRLQQQELNFRMVSIEKWVSFLLLGFILVIASFNCISSLSMLVIEKESALSTFSALGMSANKIGRIFAWESIYVSLAGGIAGLILGIILCLLQQHFGLIKIAADEGTAIISSYPVKLEWLDILLTLVPVILIGLATAWLTARFARSRINSTQ